MKTNKLILLLIGLTLYSIHSVAQKTEYFLDIQDEVRIAKELFNSSKYNAAVISFEKIQAQVDKRSEIYSEAEYYKALSAVKSGLSAGGKMMDRFIRDYQESPYLNQAKFNLAVIQFDKKRYPLAIRSLKAVDKSELTERELYLYHYQLGYSYLMTDNREKAMAEFYLIKDKNSLYSKPASYYWAHINYLDGNYESALREFSKLNGDPTYSRVIPLYVSHIYYKQGKYDEIINYTVPIIGQVEESHKAELSKIVGDSYFHLKEFAKAIPYLETYYQSGGLKSREDNYLLGYCYYSTGEYAKSVPYLEKASKGNDELAQNAYYHLAGSYIKTGRKEKARVAFEAASELDFDPRIKEDALFNYAKITYELSYSPFNETIKAFDKYIALYPSSERNSMAYQYLVQVFMVTKNYKDAINSIEKIKVRNTAINKAYQRVTFYRGLELFNNLKYNRAIENFDKSLENSFADRELKARAIYWKAEALYRLGDYNRAINEYNTFLLTPGAFSLPEYRDAHYNLAYSYFKLEDYDAAKSHFRKFLSAGQGKRSAKIADALNRVGDCFFISRDYDEAVKNYKKAFDMKMYDPDYSLFQIAFCEGLKGAQQTKISQLRKLLNDYPESAYRDDALFELGRANERINQPGEAARQYKEIIHKFKNSSYHKKALLQLGLISYNAGNFKESLRYYKNLVENFPNTEEAKSALTGIKNNYVELNDVEAYFAYTRQLGSGVAVTASEQDMLIYQAAEKLFMAGSKNAAVQFKKYLEQFPYGAYVLNAHFYLAEALYGSGKYAESLSHYMYVASRPDNIFSETAVAKAAELTFNAQDYRKALELFGRLKAISNNKWNKLKADAGMMKCNFELGQFKDAIEAAAKVKKSEKAGDALNREADYIMAKSYYNLDNFSQALPELKKLAVETKSEQGAEAKYLISEIYYLQKKMDSAEKGIMDFISMGTPHLYWLGKSFLLLSDIYQAKGDDFQAKHTLKSVVENYGEPNDGIIAEASRKLAVIEAKEASEQKKAKVNPTEINLNHQ
ncbi:FIG00651507: hypothetical protein [hydrothermal vent metagenome]|uniref:TPR-domain-containing protein n=1 Tax=hydrothermal vent metagenome TaxID=652676 RepID=A0A3B0TVD9_9ZZZZ